MDCTCQRAEAGDASCNGGPPSQRLAAAEQCLIRRYAESVYGTCILLWVWFLPMVPLFLLLKRRASAGIHKLGLAAAHCRHQFKAPLPDCCCCRGAVAGRQCFLDAVLDTPLASEAERWGREIDGTVGAPKGHVRRLE